MIVAFTGHRPNKLGGYKLPNKIYNYVCKEIERILIELKPSKVISGMALGIDQWAANIAINLEIPVLAAVPFKGQESAWPESSQKIFNKLIARASEVVIVSEGGYSAHKMQIRNEWMVDNCNTLIAVYNGDKSGGTFNCVTYAKSTNKDIIIIDPTIIT
jgi:uncharacterized phage-like protein YoqJ